MRQRSARVRSRRVCSSALPLAPESIGGLLGCRRVGGAPLGEKRTTYSSATGRSAPRGLTGVSVRLFEPPPLLLALLARRRMERGRCDLAGSLASTRLRMPRCPSVGTPTRWRLCRRTGRNLDSRVIQAPKWSRMEKACLARYALSPWPRETFAAKIALVDLRQRPRGGSASC